MSRSIMYHQGVYNGWDSITHRPIFNHGMSLPDLVLQLDTQLNDIASTVTAARHLYQNSVLLWDQAALYFSRKASHPMNAQQLTEAQKVIFVSKFLTPGKLVTLAQGHSANNTMYARVPVQKARNHLRNLPVYLVKSVTHFLDQESSLAAVPAESTLLCKTESVFQVSGVQESDLLTVFQKLAKQLEENHHEKMY